MSEKSSLSLFLELHLVNQYYFCYYLSTLIKFIYLVKYFTILTIKKIEKVNHTKFQKTLIKPLLMADDLVHWSAFLVDHEHFLYTVSF